MVKFEMGIAASVEGLEDNWKKEGKDENLLKHLP